MAEPGSRVLFVVVAIALLGGGAWYLYSTPKSQATNTATFSYTNASADTIVVSSPRPGATVSKTFSITGSARGRWYFEATFPVEVLDQNGAVMVQKPGTAQGEWMTENLVPFSVRISISASYSGPATVVLKKDNPSGMPEKDASVSFPITIQ